MNLKFYSGFTWSRSSEQSNPKSEEKKITNGDERTNFFPLLPDEQGGIKDTFS